MLVHRSPARRLPRAAAASLALASALALASCSETGENAEEGLQAGEGSIIEEEVEDVPVEATTTVQAVVEDPAAFSGEAVVLEARTATVVGDGAFFLAEDAVGTAFVPENSLLVLGGGVAPGEGDAVYVVGEVRDQLDPSTVEADLGLDLPEGVLDDYEGGAWVEAESVEVLATLGD